MTGTNFTTAEEFTQEAIRLARETTRDQTVGERVTNAEPEETKHVVHLYLSDRDIELLNRLMDLGVSKSKEAITRSRRFPTENIKSSMTIDRNESIINHIEYLRNHLSEEAQW